MTQELKNVITSAAGSPAIFGDTLTGADWCVKALHPSDPLTEVRGIPDHSSVPTLCMNFQSTATLTIASGETTPWDWNLTLLPHPLYTAYWEGPKAHDPTSGLTGVGNFWNTQLVATPGVPTIEDLRTAWLGMARRWRLCYQSVTVIQDGPDLANQGTIVVCQAPLEPRITTLSSSDPLGGLYMSRRAAYFDYDAEGPSFTRSQAMPNAYMERSKAGVYVPLKLTNTFQEWHSDADSLTPVNVGTPLPYSDSNWIRVQSTYSPTYPFHDVQTTYGTVGGLHGEAVPSLCNGNVAHICARNLSDQTSFTFYFRSGFELQLAPSSPLTPQLKLSPPYDPKALDLYYRISRELKDAYPSSYNREETMGRLIGDLARSVLPVAASFIPGIGPFAPLATTVGQTIAAGVRRRRRQRRRRQGPPPLRQQSAPEWAAVPESDADRQLRRAAESRLARDMSAAQRERALENRRQRPSNRGRRR